MNRSSNIAPHDNGSHEDIGLMSGFFDYRCVPSADLECIVWRKGSLMVDFHYQSSVSLWKMPTYGQKMVAALLQPLISLIVICNWLIANIFSLHPMLLMDDICRWVADMWSRIATWSILPQ